MRMLQAVAGWVHPAGPVVAAAAAGGEDGEEALLDGCRALAALVSIHPAEDFHAGYSLLGSLTCECLQAGALSSLAEDTAVAEALSMLLEAWAALLQGPQRRGWGQSVEQQIPAGILQAAQQVFQTFAQGALATASQEAFQDEGGEDATGSAGALSRDDQLVNVAVLARANPAASLGLLDTLLGERLARVQQLAGSGGDCSQTWEELCWLVRMSAHALADDGDGETPVIPPTLMTAGATAAGAGTADPAEQLSRRLLEMATSAGDPAHQALLSPRLLEALLWAVSRWADTYLMPEDSGGSLHHFTQQGPLSVAITRAFGEASGGGAAALAILVQAVVAALLYWPGEIQLQTEATSTLLPILTRRRALCRHLINLESWQQLAGAYAQQDPRLLALAPPQHRGLLHSLGQAALGFSDAAQTEAYIVALLKPMLEELRRLVGSSDRDQIGQRPETEQMLMRVLEALRGILKATHPRFQPVVFRFVHEMMPGLLEVQKLVRRNPMVTLLLLKAVRAFTEMHATLLECITPDQMHTLARFCLGLVTQYSQDLAGSHQVAGAIESQERYKQLLTLLKLLTDLTDRDLQSLAPAPVTGSADSADVAQVVLLGLHLVIPLISPELLKFPKLCRQYFTLLSVLLDSYPERVAALPTAALTT
ncbi:hypothetical protein CYMTET_50978, partial [Cymbomonas tetramitiformis]